MHERYMDKTLDERKEMFYLTTHSTHFIYSYMASDIWLRTILIVRKETCCRHIGYSFQLAARVLLYAPPHRQDNTYHGLCGALAGTRNSSMGPPHEGDKTLDERMFGDIYDNRLVNFQVHPISVQLRRPETPQLSPSSA